MQRALGALQLLAFGPCVRKKHISVRLKLLSCILSVPFLENLLQTCGTMGQFFFGDTGHPLEVIVAGVAEVCGAKAKENCH